MRIFSAMFALLVASGCLTATSGEPDLPSEAAAFVWVAPYPRLLIEIDHVEGYEPSEEAVAHLVSVLKRVTDKASVEVLPYQTLPRLTSLLRPEHEWTAEALVQYAAEHLSSAPPGEHVAEDYAVIHVLLLDGDYPGYSGVALDQTAFLFEPSSYSTEIYERGATGDLVQRRLLLHEVGHVLGLVNRGIPMVKDHAHPDDPHHSANPRSVMWSGLDDMDVVRGLLDEKDGPPSEFDADDLADLAAFREEGRRWAAANGYS